MKILFLDIDGVLNSMPSNEIREKWDYDKELYNKKLFGLDPDLVKLLKIIINKTNCKIVFSTSWRYYKDHPIEGSDWRQNLINMLGVSPDIFIGNTPDLSVCNAWDSGNFIRQRGNEIKFWLENNTQPGSFTYCVIDDDIDDIEPFIPKKRIIKTDPECGLTMDNVNNVIEILNK